MPDSLSCIPDRIPQAKISPIPDSTSKNFPEPGFRIPVHGVKRDAPKIALDLYLDFRLYFEATSPNCVNVFCKILLQSIFLARIINNRGTQRRFLLNTLKTVFRLSRVLLDLYKCILRLSNWRY